MLLLLYSSVLFAWSEKKMSCCSGVDKCDGPNATDGLQTYQLCQSEDDDNTAHWSSIQRGLSSALLPVSTHANLHFKFSRNHAV